jgi:ApaG protein
MSIKNNNISIKVHSNFIQDRSLPENSIFLFSYDVVIKNHNLFDVQLLSRYWHIQDGNGVVEEVRGPGVIGLKPVIKSDGTFKYSSFCPIKTPLGVMKGSYKMRSTKEEVFEAKIASFTLRANEYVN